MSVPHGERASTQNEKLLPGRATPQATKDYAARFASRAANGHFRGAAGGLNVSSIGIGTYLGEADAATDRRYTEAAIAAGEGGINFIDTAINYRLQRSERSVGAALQTLVARGHKREEFVVCTKAGFLTPDAVMPDDANEYFQREYIERDVFRAEDIAAGCHSIAPKFLADQLERSRRNLGLECIDVFYLHNPETQLGEISREEFRRRLRGAFGFCELAVARGKITAYGLATWKAFRENPKSESYLSLEETASIAREVAGDAHHFRFVQLPLNLAMPEGLTNANQVVNGKTMAMVQAARPLGITLVASAALLQGQLTRKLPAQMAQVLGLSNDAERALQFVRSVPGLTTALVGMSRVEHVVANLALLSVEPAPRDQFLKLFGHGR
ncbi:MAG TPA: aldo/keto reductase [Candidatus Acidoferrales bacterium]|nr:aldo/keto reductase [Candidatus Acidoferrales bacterium]